MSTTVHTATQGSVSTYPAHMVAVIHIGTVGVLLVLGHTTVLAFTPAIGGHPMPLATASATIITTTIGGTTTGVSATTTTTGPQELAIIPLATKSGA